MKKILICCLALFYLVKAIAQPNNINVSSANFFDGEPYLAVNPVNPDNMVAAWMGFALSGGFKIGIKTKSSFDGGITWGNYFIQPHFSTSYHSADVSMCFRNDGVLFMSYIDYRENPDSGGVYVSRSDDGGITWSLPVLAFDAYEDGNKRPIDRPWLVIDNSTTSNYGTLYLTTKPAPWILPPNRPYLKYSIDSGLSWSAFRYVDTTGFMVGNVIAQPMGAPVTALDGSLNIAYPSYEISQSFFPKIYFARSTDRGGTFQYTDLLVNPSPVADTNYKLGYQLVSNPANANQLAYSYVSNQNGDPDIYITTTNDGGLTWNIPVRINDDGISNGKAQDMVWSDYAANGDLAVTWRDRRNSAGSGFYQSSDFYGAVSHDNGSTFQSNFRLSSLTAPFDSILMESGNDFMSCELVNDSVNAIWGDVRSGKLNIYFAKISATTGLGTGVSEITSEESGQIVVFPNPANDHVLIKLPIVDCKLDLDVFDLQGKIIYSKKNINSTENINCDQFSNGTYSIMVRCGDSFFNTQFEIKR